MVLELTREEYELLQEILHERDREMFREIARTDSREYKHKLREMEAVISSIEQKLAAAQKVAA